MISDKKINKFEITIGYIFKNKKLLINSLVHPSSLTDSKKNKIKVANDFERLEFLGDRVLGLAISSIIYGKFKENNEGDLSKKLSYLVQKNFLHKISIDLKIDDILNYSFKKNEKMNVSILADSIESFAVDQGTCGRCRQSRDQTLGGHFSRADRRRNGANVHDSTGRPQR